LDLIQTSLSTCDDNIEKYCSKFTQELDEQIIANGEEHVGNNLTEDNLVNSFIRGLNGSSLFDSFILNFRQKEIMPKLEETMSLAREGARIHKSGTGTRDDPIALSTQRGISRKRKRKTGTCPKHPSMSHEKDCWVLLPEKQPKK